MEELRALHWPEDFPARLGRLEDLSGVSLEKFSRTFGLPEERAKEWRSGAMPKVEEVWAMALWSCYVPGGLSVLLPVCPCSQVAGE